jgi:hypothetical protein
MPDPLPEDSKSKVTRGKSTPKKEPAREPISGAVIETTGQAERVAKELRVKLGDMVDAAALMRANRRRATALDRVDYEAAFDDVVNPIPRPRRLVLIGDVCLTCGGAFIGYATNIYVGFGPSYQIGHITILAGVILAGTGICLKNIDLSR